MYQLNKKLLAKPSYSNTKPNKTRPARRQTLEIGRAMLAKQIFGGGGTKD